MPTLADVARVAGVTAATVSNVLTGRVGVREETRERVLAAIAQTGYRPNLVARGLARGQTFTLALLVPSVANPFFAEVVEVVEAVADAHEYQLLLALSHRHPEQGTRHLERLASRWVDGFLIMGGAAPTAEVMALAQTQTPVVLSVWEQAPEVNTLPRVEIDFRRAGELATQHLIERGHQRIAAIVELPVQQTRLSGYQASMATTGLPIPTEYLRVGDSSFASGYTEAQALLALPQPPTAIFAGNDAMALGALEAAHQAKVAVPDALAVVGVDDVPAAAYAHPPLSTVRIPTRELASAAVEMLLGRIVGTTPPLQHLLAPTLVIRQST